MKRLIASLLFFVTTTIFADPAPFGLEIGKATVADAEKMYRIEKTGDYESINGIIYRVAVNQVDFEGLKELRLVFNKKGILGLNAYNASKISVQINSSISRKKI